MRTQFGASVSGLQHLSGIKTQQKDPADPHKTLNALQVVESALEQPQNQRVVSNIPRLELQVDKTNDGNFWIRINRIFQQGHDRIFSRDESDQGGYAIVDSFETTPEQVAKDPIDFVSKMLTMLKKNEPAANRKYEVDNLYEHSYRPIGE